LNGKIRELGRVQKAMIIVIVLPVFQRFLGDTGENDKNPH
jgi:hypothetical protein